MPVNDPLLLVPAMAAVTQHLGFGVTANLTYEPPYLFARRMSTLDHLTGGRIGWNIVTGYLDSAARGMGLTASPTHDDRYDVADEYMEVVYKLWEGSWEDGAVRARPGQRASTPTRPRCTSVQHRRPALPGRRASISASRRRSARRCCIRPAPRRAAATSPRTHAECVFLYGPNKRASPAMLVADIRGRAAAHGRDPERHPVLLGRAVVVGRTRKEAEEKYEDYHALREHRGGAGAFLELRRASTSPSTIPTSRSATRRTTR